MLHILDMGLQLVGGLTLILIGVRLWFPAKPALKKPERPLESVVVLAMKHALETGQLDAYIARANERNRKRNTA